MTVAKLEQQDQLSLLKQSLYTIRKLREKLSETQTLKNDPIAVIGMACRFPGGCNNPEEFWEFLKGGGDGAIDIPPDRWNIDDYYEPSPGKFGKMYVKQGNFLQLDVGEFDARFFGISPAEATEMDPQHRLLLEVSLEALETAGQNVEQIKGTNTGVFVGLSNSEYRMLSRDFKKINPYAGIGTLSSVASGRISFVLGLNGPALTLDTACSSSLVSTFYAVEALRRGECDMALSGGVNLMLSPHATSSLCMMGALSRDGKCKPFDANGDGYGRAEGCGVLVLKRFSTANKDGDNVYAIIRGGTVNNDGLSSGLTVPNGIAQRELIKSALSKCSVKPDEVSYLEAHGTGTSLGDPIEMKAVTEVFGQNRSRDNPLIIGTVKGNVGHLESAAGIAGLIKVVLCLHHKEIPRNVNLDTPNPGIRFEKIPAEVPLEHMQWNPGNGRERIAGISSFGFSGTNAHLLLSEAPFCETSAKNAASKFERPLSLMGLSAKSETALRNIVINYYKHLREHPNLDIRDVCYTANACRANYSYRAAFIGEGLNDFRAAFNRFLTEEKDGKHEYVGKINENARPKIVFLFSGSIGDSLSKTRDLYETLPSFNNSMDKCAILFESHLGSSILDWLYPENGEKRTAVPHGIKEACLFAIEYSLVELFELWGITPAAVFGERTGSYVAAYSSGVMSLESAVEHVVAASRLAELRNDIKSARVFAKKDEVEKVLNEFGEKIQVSANYGASGIVITGISEVVEIALGSLKGQGFETAEVADEVWPSSLYEDYLGDFKTWLEGEQYQGSKLRFISSSSGKSVKKSEIKSIAYWQKQLVSIIEYEKGIAALYDQGYRQFVAIGPDLNLINKIVVFLSDDEVNYFEPLKLENQWKSLLECVARFYCSGTEINWQNFDKDYFRQKVLLPTYPFERKRYWIAPSPEESIEVNPESESGAVLSNIPDDPLKGRPIISPLKDIQYEYILSVKRLPELEDTHGMLHVGYYQEMLVRAIHESFGNTRYVVKTTEFISALVIPADIIKAVLLILDPDDKKEIKFNFYSRDHSGKNWSMHVQGLIQLYDSRAIPEMTKATLSEIKARCDKKYSGLVFYQMMEERGLHLGFSVQWVDEVWYREGEALARFRKPMENEDEKRYQLKMHPGIMDACAQVFHAALPNNIPADMKYMVVNWDDFVINSSEMNEELWCHVVLHENSINEEIISGKCCVLDRIGNSIACSDNIRMKGLSSDRMEAFKTAMETGDAQGERDEVFYEMLHGSPKDRRMGVLIEYLQKEMAKIMDMPLSELDVDEPLRNLGMDSLIGVRFKGRIDSGLDIELPMEDLLSGGSISEMAESLINLLSDGGRSESLYLKERKLLPIDKSDLELWILNRNIIPEAKIRLFCFPYGGGGASIFNRWQDKLFPNIEVCPVQLPGRENRIYEKSFDNIEDVVDGLESVFEDKLFDMPCAFYGHSMGSLIAFCLARKLLRDPKVKPVHLFVAGYTAPIIHPNPFLQKIKQVFMSAGFKGLPKIDQVSDLPSEIIDEFIGMPEMTIADAGNNGKLVRKMLPFIISELRVIESFRYADDDEFNLPITAFHGKEDERVHANEIEAWREVTCGTFSRHVLPGDHFFLHEDQSEEKLVELIFESLFS